VADFYFTQQGDITVSANGDIGVTETIWRDDSQQAYVRLMTDIGDFSLYPGLGADLSRLYGMPQSEATANVGKELISAALSRENRFAGKAIVINAAPTGPQTIRFDVYVVSGSRDQLILSIQQDLGVIPELEAGE
jgi:hypothetical protein